MKSEAEEYYPEHMICMLEAIWGEGFLSPGGPEEVARITGNQNLHGLKLLDIGCGAGGIDIALIESHHAAHVTGIDVEAGVLSHAKQIISQHGLNNRVKLIKVEPGPFPFPDSEFDVVFSKDSIIHIPDKYALMTEVYRILRPGGQFMASDWLIGTESVSPAMAEYIKGEGLNFQMSSPDRYRNAMEKAGFKDIKIDSRNQWYRQQARKELARLKGTLGKELALKTGRKFIDDSIKSWERMISVLDTGEHCPSHLHAVKP